MSSYLAQRFAEVIIEEFGDEEEFEILLMDDDRVEVVEALRALGAGVELSEQKPQCVRVFTKYVSSGLKAEQ